MSLRLAPIGSLLKQPKPARKPKLDLGREPRIRDEAHLEAIRRCSCLGCGMDPCGEAAHVRMSSAAHGKRNALGAKPHDKWSLPLCHDCHMRQHGQGEEAFWAELGLNPLLLAARLFSLSPNVEAMRAAAFVIRFIGEEVDDAAPT